MTGKGSWLTVFFLGVPLLKVYGPLNHLAGWASDPDLSLTMPGLSVTAGLPRNDSSVFTIEFRQSRMRKIYYVQKITTIIVDGDLASFLDRDFRRLIMYVAKTAIKLRGYAFIHSACLRSPRGKALLLCGKSGSGKTTLSLHLTRQGYKIISTDITVVNNHMEAVAGTRHLTIYPELQSDMHKGLLPETVISGTMQSAFLRKSAIPQKTLRRLGLFESGTARNRISLVIILSLRQHESVPYCEPVPDCERLYHSGLLDEGWSTSTWLCPSWGLFFPLLPSRKADANRNQLALLLSEVPHIFLNGDKLYCAQQIAATGL